MMLGDWDPNTLFTSFDEPRLIWDRTGTISAKVDEIDYLWAIQWLWSPKPSRGGKKIYMRRNAHTTLSPSYRVDGQRVRVRLQQTVFLHVVILRDRMGVVPPSEKHTIAEHRNGNGLDCRRENLRWATPSQNARNINGKYGGYIGDF